MAIKEHENNIFTKEHDSPIENYLRNIIQRYFQIENDISQESKEAIIIQAYTRLKEIINAYSEKYIICINEKSGAIDLSYKDIDCEPAFDKNTAFNKDFCSYREETKTAYDGTEVTYYKYGNEEEGKIVEGDDDRLSDIRIPLYHTHEMKDINGIEDLLNRYAEFKEYNHVHNNFNILEMIEYTGSRVEIDLILLEDLCKKVDLAVDKFKDTDEYVANIYKKISNELTEDNIIKLLIEKLNYIQENIDSWIDYYEESRIYTDFAVSAYTYNIEQYLKNFLSKEEYAILKNIFDHAVKLVEQGSFDIGRNDFKVTICDPVLDHNTYHMYKDTVEYKKFYGYTNLSSNCSDAYTITNSNTLEKLDGQINNGQCKLFLEYGTSNVKRRDMLPYIYWINENDFIYVYGNTDSNNNINIHFERKSIIPVYLYNQLIISAICKNIKNIESDFAHKIIYSTDHGQHYYELIPETEKLYDSVSDNFNTFKHIPAWEEAVNDIVNNKRIRDVGTVVSEFSGNNPGPNNGSNPTGLKKIVTFSPKYDYNGPITVRMNTGHFYGFDIYEITVDSNKNEISEVRKVFNNIRTGHLYGRYWDNFDTHLDDPEKGPITIVDTEYQSSANAIHKLANVNLQAGKAYKIVVEECVHGNEEGFNYKINPYKRNDARRVLFWMPDPNVDGSTSKAWRSFESVNITLGTVANDDDENSGNEVTEYDPNSQINLMLGPDVFNVPFNRTDGSKGSYGTNDSDGVMDDYCRNNGLSDYNFEVLWATYSSRTIKHPESFIPENDGIITLEATVNKDVNGNTDNVTVSWTNNKKAKTEVHAIYEYPITEEDVFISELNSLQAGFGGEGTPKNILTFVPKGNTGTCVYKGKIALTMNTGHWYGFDILKKQSNGSFTRIYTCARIKNSDGTDNLNGALLSHKYTGDSVMWRDDVDGWPDGVIAYFQSHKDPYEYRLHNGKPVEHATHLDRTSSISDPSLTIGIPYVELYAGEEYKIQTFECDGGGSDPSDFMYSKVLLSPNSGYPNDFEIVRKLETTKWIETEDPNFNNGTRFKENRTETIGYDFTYKLLKRVQLDEKTWTNWTIAASTDQNFYIDTDFKDVIPYKPIITGECISETDDSQTYDVNIYYPENKTHRFEYKLEVIQKLEYPAASYRNCGITPAVSVDFLMNLKEKNFSTNLVDKTYTPSSEYDLLLQEDETYKKHIQIKIDKYPGPFNDKIIFCDNTYSGQHMQLNDYLDDYSCSLAFSNSTEMKKYLKFIYLLNEYNDDAPIYHLNNSLRSYFDGTNIIEKNDIDRYYYGEYRFLNPVTFLQNAKCIYQIFEVPQPDEEQTELEIDPEQEEGEEE